MSQATLDDLRQRLAGLTPDFYVEAAPKPPSAADVADLEGRLGMKLPSDYREFLLTYGALTVEANENVWPRPRIGDVGPHWMQTGFRVLILGTDPEVPDVINVEHHAADFEDMTGLSYVPFLMHENSRDCLCFDKEGKVREWFNGDDDATPLDSTFLDTVIAALEELQARTTELKASK